jgi:HK97 gp10 family phage protein
MLEIQIDGLAELKRQLDQLPAKIEGNVMRGALRAGVNVLKKEAEAHVPVKTGALRKSMRISFARKSQRYGWLRAHLKAGNKEAWYAHLIEYGTASYYSGTGKTVGGPYDIRASKGKSLFFAGIFSQVITHPGIRPQPFMRPALDKAAAPALDAVAHYIRNRLPKELAKHGAA